MKLVLASDPDMDIARYIVGKSAVLQNVLAVSEPTEDERHRIWQLNDPDASMS